LLRESELKNRNSPRQACYRESRRPESRW
jgi:hypothetical protein